MRIAVCCSFLFFSIQLGAADFPKPSHGGVSHGGVSVSPAGQVLSNSTSENAGSILSEEEKAAFVRLISDGLNGWQNHNHIHLHPQPAEENKTDLVVPATPVVTTSPPALPVAAVEEHLARKNPNAEPGVFQDGSILNTKLRAANWNPFRRRPDTAKSCADFPSCSACVSDDHQFPCMWCKGARGRGSCGEIGTPYKGSMSCTPTDDFCES